MSTLNPIAYDWFAWMTASCWQLALMVCLVAAACFVARGASPRLRHGLWLLVLVKVFLPPSLTTPWSVGHWAVAPLLNAPIVSRLSAELTSPSLVSAEAQAADSPVELVPDLPRSDQPLSLPAILLIVWIAGALLLWGMVGWRYLRLLHATRLAPAIDEGPARVALEQIALELGLRQAGDLYATNLATSPFLFGVFRPQIVLPEPLLAQLDTGALRSVLTHELVHWKRYDTWIGWLQALAQGLFWFHPFLWWANRQLRHERECACDETVLRLGQISPQNYSDSIFRVLTASRGRSLVAGSLVGVFERGAGLQNRLEDIMNYESTKRPFGWLSCLVLAAFAIGFLPMAPGMIETGLARAQESADPGGTPEAGTPFPRIVKSDPQPGATDVDPGLKEITVTFDRDMSKGMSWTGGPPLLPPTDAKREARWTDARTCVLPVSLKKGSYYRLGINSTSYTNFRSSDGVAARPATIFFATQGANDQIKRRASIPQVVSFEPDNGQTDVDPKTAKLKVTFNVPMESGMSWVGGGPDFPKTPAGKKAAWSKDGLTCSLPVTLEAGHDYQLGLNSEEYVNFSSKWGVPLAPVVYKFRTRGAK